MNKGVNKIRKVKLHIILGILVCGIVLGSTDRVCAENWGLGVTPEGWDYGNVLVGTSQTITFDLESKGPTAVWIYLTMLTPTPDLHDPLAVSPIDGNYTLGAFSFNPLNYPALPRETPTGDHVLIDVIFTPPAPGDYSVYLGIYSNDSIDPPGPHSLFLLEGTGIAAAVAEPATILLLGSGLLGVAGIRRRMKK